MTTITIDPRFNGPPDSANGGYISGLLAGLVPAAAVEVTLRRPPPLGRPLTIAHEDPATVFLFDGDTLVAEARPATLDLAVPDPVPTLDQARAAPPPPPEILAKHPFPTCFGCGPQRDPADAVRAIVGPVGDVFACTWTPTAALPHADGHVAPEVVAALDCPTAGAAVPWGSPPHVLGRLTARLDAPVALDAEHVIVSWAPGHDGRKRHGAAAVITPDGSVAARSHATWIALR